MPRETISPEAEAIREALVHVGIAVASLNPDPTQTIAEHQARQARQDRRSRWSLIIAIVAVVFSSASLAAAWVVPRIAPVETQKMPVPTVGAVVLWVGASIEGGPVITWLNAVRAFENRNACDGAAKSAAMRSDAIPRSLQEKRMTYVLECFPSERSPNAVKHF